MNHLIPLGAKFKEANKNLHNPGIYAASSSLTKSAQRRHKAMLISLQIRFADFSERLASAWGRRGLVLLAVLGQDQMADPEALDRCCTRLLQPQLQRLREMAPVELAQAEQEQAGQEQVD